MGLSPKVYCGPVICWQPTKNIRKIHEFSAFPLTPRITDDTFLVIKDVAGSETVYLGVNDVRKGHPPGMFYFAAEFEETRQYLTEKLIAYYVEWIKITYQPEISLLEEYGLVEVTCGMFLWHS